METEQNGSNIKLLEPGSNLSRSTDCPEILRDFSQLFQVQDSWLN
jgi:hypothetical protein